MFTCVLSELSPNTTYYFRAFATNIQGTGYGQTKSFMTLGGKGKKGKKEQEMDFQMQTTKEVSISKVLIFKT